MESVKRSFDIAVCGGGIGGVITAISAARKGMRVALLDNKAGLGGNANSEIGVAIEGASFFCFFPNMRETGPVEEMKEQIAAIDPFLRNSLNSATLLFWCVKEGVEVFSEMNVCSVKADGRRILSVSGSQSGSETTFEFEAKEFVDATGDGTIAALANCAFRIGREARAEFGELMAPLEADKGIMGASCGFRASRKKAPSKFARPDWAYVYEKEEDLPFRLCTIKGQPDHGFWWIEYAGDNNDPIGEYDAIRLELLKCVYGVWAYLKNDPKREMELWALDSVSVSPAKRESRRVEGDIIVTESDIVERTQFPDAVAYAGWNLDVHVPGGFKSKLRPNVHAFFPWVAPLPLRALYAKDMDNLWLVGRDISVSHVALGATRLQATIGAMGHAVGIAASLAARSGKSARAIAKDSIKEVQQEILKDGSFIPGVRNCDPNDRARLAKASASSELPLRFGASAQWLPVKAGRSVSFPVTEDGVEILRLKLKSESQSEMEVRLLFARCEHPNHVSHRSPIAESVWTLKPGENEIEWKLGACGLEPGLYAAIAMPQEGGEALWQMSSFEPYGCQTHLYEPERYFVPSKVEECDLFATPKPVMLTPGSEPFEWVRQYKPRYIKLGDPQDRSSAPLPFIAIEPAQRPYSAEQALSGSSHSDIMPELWISDPTQEMPQSLTLSWREPQEVSEIRICFDSDLDMPQPSPVPVDWLVKSYSVEALLNGAWDELASCEGNLSRFKIHKFEKRQAEAVRLKIKEVHGGGRSARVFEVRCY